MDEIFDAIYEMANTNQTGFAIFHDDIAMNMDAKMHFKNCKSQTKRC